MDNTMIQSHFRTQNHTHKSPLSFPWHLTLVATIPK